MIAEPDRSLPPATATEAPWTPRGLSWRSAWPSIVLAIAAFQAGVIATLVVVWDRLDEPRTTPAPAPAPDREVVAPAGAPPLTSAPAPPMPTPTVPTKPLPPARIAPPRHAPAASPALVEVEIDSAPAGATVRIAGAVWGVTPLTAFLPDQPTWIDLELAGHETARARWTPGSSVHLRIDLHPME